MATPTNVRFAESIEEALARHIRRTGHTKSAVISTAVYEWLAMQEHVSIRFRTAETGERRAALADGPEVWAVAQSWLDHEDRTSANVAATLELSQEAVEAALGYWADHRSEIDGILERHRAAQDEALAAWERRQSLLGAHG
ncbi:hypothetical protein [Brevibacterium album]|uniref:hypothetical protein n=1 Tax=Brevibacterium album TaxID=417948 RepID=UPI00040F6C7B|nr:hypothetical protein [Brevibacterium album]